MVDRIKKSLNRLPRRDRDAAERSMALIKRGETNHLKIKKLRGHNNVFRARKGKLRIIFQRTEKKITILDVSYRSDTTYKKY